MSKNATDFLLHALGGAVVFFASTVPAGLFVGRTMLVVLAGSVSAIICAAAIEYFRELEQFHYNPKKIS